VEAHGVKRWQIVVIAFLVMLSGWITRDLSRAELPAAARELVQHGVDLIFTSGVTATKAAQRVTQTTPIVFTAVDDPVAFGLVKKAMATMFNDAFYVERGELASYGPNFYETGQLAARLVDKILKGTKLAGIPVEVNNNIKFVINLKATQELGLTIPPEVLYQADQIIR
jgi:ABC-type uncharacterized transport system substrate-binding protein